MCFTLNRLVNYRHLQQIQSYSFFFQTVLQNNQWFPPPRYEKINVKIPWWVAENEPSLGSSCQCAALLGRKEGPTKITHYYTPDRWADFLGRSMKLFVTVTKWLTRVIVILTLHLIIRSGWWWWSSLCTARSLRMFFCRFRSYQSISHKWSFGWFLGKPASYGWENIWQF